MLPLALGWVLVAGVPVAHPGISKCALTLQDPGVHQADSGPGAWGRSVVEVSIGQLDSPDHA